MASEGVEKYSLAISLFSSLDNFENPTVIHSQ
jgi:hypothetical protein